MRCTQEQRTTAVRRRRRRLLPPCCHHRALIVNGLIYAGFTATWQGRFRAAVSACHDAVQVAEAAHDAEHLAAAPFCLALALAGCGEYEAALAGLHDLLAFANTTGEPYYAVHAQHHRLDLSRVGTHRASSALG